MLTKNFEKNTELVQLCVQITLAFSNGGDEIAIPSFCGD
jgi:hypothetical protein